MDDSASVNPDLISGEVQSAFDALVEAVAFYADPDSYFAIYIRGEAPYGDFGDDFSLVPDSGYDRPMPGAKARAALEQGPRLLDALADAYDLGLASAHGYDLSEPLDREEWLAGKGRQPDNPYREV